MGKFKVGDRVVRTTNRVKWGGMLVGDTDTVVKLTAGTVTLAKYGEGHSYDYLELVNACVWCAHRADELRKIAEDAITDYNMFLALQPEQYKPMEIK